MPERLSLATVAACAVLAAAVFGGTYALAHDEPAKPTPAPTAPTAVQLQRDPIGELHRVSALPALIVPAPRPEPTQTVPVIEDQAPVVTTPEPQAPEPQAPVATPTPTPAPAPAPTPAPAPKPAPTRKPLTFDDSG